MVGLHSMENKVKPFKVSRLLTAVVLAVPSLALAQQAYAAKDLHLRAGPARDYPVVAMLPLGSNLFVQGCLGDYTWCDVISGPLRGWVYAANIDYAYQGNWVPVLGYGAQLGIGVAAFILGDYWSSYYVDRPWFRDRDRWLRHPPPRLRPPPPRPLPLPPPHGDPGRPYPKLPGAPGAGRPHVPQRGEPPRLQPPQRGGPPRVPPPQRGEPPRAQPPQRGEPPRAQPPQRGEPPRAQPPQRGEPPQRSTPGGRQPAPNGRPERER